MKRILVLAVLVISVCCFSSPALAENDAAISFGEACLYMDVLETQKCPACKTTERTEEVKVPYEAGGAACASTSCESQNTTSGQRWKCKFVGTDQNGQPKQCVVTYPADPTAPGGWGTGVVNLPCRNQGITAPPETSPNMGTIPNLAGLKADAVAKAGEFCKCKDECDKTNTCQVDPNFTPSVDTGAGNGGVTGSTSEPKIGGTGAPRGCKGTVTVAIRVKCDGKCERKLHVAGHEEDCAAEELPILE